MGISVMKFGQIFFLVAAVSAAKGLESSRAKRNAVQVRRFPETQQFFDTPNFDNALDMLEEIGMHAAGIWSVIVVAYNAMNDIFLTDSYNEIGEIFSWDWFYAVWLYLYPAATYISYLVDGTSAWNNAWNYYFTRVTMVKFIYNTFCTDCNILS